MPHVLPHPGSVDPPTSIPARRRRWMAVLARAPAEAIEGRLDVLSGLPSWRVLRGPESGLVMVRGRAGAGAVFNLGEMTVTRCTVRVDAGGQIGHAYVAGRNGRQAELAAVVDALLLDPARRGEVADAVIEPLAEAQAAVRAALAAKAAATRVQFFALQTMRS